MKCKICEKECKNYYIYIYLDPRKPGKYKYGDYCFLYEPFYVGKGKNERYREIYGRTEYFERINNKIKKSGLKPIVIKLKENLEEAKAFELEIELIKLIGRGNLKDGPLINMVDGGEGVSGYKHTIKTKNKISKKQIKNFNDIKNEFEKRKYKLLTEEKDYENCYQKLYCICNKGHKHSVTWHNFKQESGCKICDNEKRSKKLRKNFSDIKKEFERIDYKLLTKEKDYKNAFTKLEYICPEGHQYSIRWNDFQQGHGCFICWKENNNGINGPNHKLTEQNIIKIKLLLKERRLNNREIGELFGVCSQTILKIKTGKRWSHIKIKEDI